MPDVIADIKFYKTKENGRKTATDANFFRCIFVLQGNKYDCRLLLGEIGPILPGESKTNVPIKFLCPENILHKLKKGSQFYLWDMRNIAEGSVKDILTG